MNLDLSKLGKIASVLFLALAMAGCGGSGGQAEAPPEPEMHPVNLMGLTAGYMLGDGTVEVAAGMTVQHGDVAFTCAEGGAACSISIDGGVATSTGGMATAADSTKRMLAMAQEERDRVQEERDRVQEARERAERLSGLYSAAQMARDDAETAGTASKMAVTDAMKYSAMLDVKAANGESMVAAVNAREVLRAETAAMTALADAQDALRRANVAKTSAEDIDDANLMAAIDAAVKAAEEQVKATTDALDEDGDLAEYVKSVTGEDDDMPMTPADHAKMVAMAVGAALAPTDGTDSTSLRHVHVDNAVPAMSQTNAVTMDDHQGMSWTAVAGTTKKMRVAAEAPTGSATREVDAKSVDGMDYGLITGSGPDVSDEDIDVANGAEYTAATYMGIDGVVFCAGTCKVTAGADNATNDDDKLTGDWYFAPDLAPGMAYWLKEGDIYTMETLYARWGHWLGFANTDSSTDGSEEEVTIQTYAMTSGNTAGLDVNTVNNTGTVLTDSSATYSGMASGVSLHKTFDSDGNIDAIYTGAFMADVELTAKFGANPMLGGTVDRFRSESGMNVDSTWSVSLVETAFANATIEASDDAQARTSAGQVATDAGRWTATGYGPAQVGGVGSRPTGIFGQFNAHFSDGHAAAAYATRKPD